MKSAVITYPGSNCDQDLIYALQQVLGQPVVHLWHGDTDLQGAELVCVPGGFSYGDYLRSGAIARFAPIMEAVAAHAAKGGLVLGICNGFQILTESGLVPGTLLRNEQQLFVCDNVYIRPATHNTRMTEGLEDRAYKIPIAHAEGNFFLDADGLKALEDGDQILFRYCDAQGNITPEANPNGSLQNIAGVCNAGRNVFAMMPHPERACDAWQGNEDGLPLFRSLLGQALSMVK